MSPTRRSRPAAHRVPALAAAEVLLGEQQRSAKLLGLEHSMARAGLDGRDAGPAGMGPAPTVVHEPGGRLIGELLHPSFLVFERLFRALPEEGMFSAEISRRRPFQFALGSFEVPHNRTLWMCEYEFGVLGFDGVNPGDLRPAESGRFSGSMGFDLTVSDARHGDIAYQLDPVPIQTTRPQFEEVVVAGPLGKATTSKFNRTASSSFASVSSQGTSLLPVREQMQGPDGKPWTWIVEEGTSVALKCVVFRPIRSPIGGVFGRIAGHLLHTNVAKALENRLRPR